MAKKTAPATPSYKLLLFTRERCAPCAVAKPQVEQAAHTLNLPLELVDAMSEPGGSLVLGFNILSVPTLIALKDGKKWHEFAGAKDLSAKHLVDKLSKAIAKDTQN